MRSLLFSIQCLSMLLSGVTYSQPKIDTAREIINPVDIRYKMRNDPKDQWNVLFYRQNFGLFMKQHFIDTAHKPRNAATISYFGNASICQLNNTKAIELAIPAINPQNAHLYRYHVVENDSIELVSWATPAVFRANRNTAYAYLGQYTCLNKILRVEIYKTDDYKNKLIILFNGGYMPAPRVNNVVINYNDRYLFMPDKQEHIPSSKQRRFWPDAWHKNKMKIQWSNEINHLSVEMKNTIQNDMYRVYLTRIKNGKTDTLYVANNWEQSYYTPNPSIKINAAYFNKAGNYRLIIKPEMNGFNPSGHVAAEVIPFTILPGPVAVPAIIVVYIIAAIIIIVFLVFWAYRARQHRRLSLEAQKKQVAALQLQSVRSQLNPHFVFNALAGIQNLMNKQEMEHANKYLSRFARLTRHILDDGAQELTTIEQEADLLNDYLQMEQLRFGFSYKINVDDSIDQQIRIPAMLLQPFAENAVKHGVSAMGDEGLVTIGINGMDNNLMLTVNDNGKGFNLSDAQGMGIKLCRERIELLNSIYKNSTILLLIEPGRTNTSVTIQLQNWL